MFRRVAANFARTAVRAAPKAKLAFALTSVSAAATFAMAAPATYTGVPGTPGERTFIALKPDAVQRGLVGEIIARFERKGYKLVAMKMVHPTKKQAEDHYSDLSTKPFFPALVNFFSSGPIVAMVWEGQGVVKGGRVLLGTTNPADSAPGSIRGDYCVVTGRNIIHGSDSTDSAAHEIAHWFKEGEVITWTPAEATWVYEK